MSKKKITSLIVTGDKSGKKIRAVGIIDIHRIIEAGIKWKKIESYNCLC